MPQPVYRLRLVLSRVGEQDEGDVLVMAWPLILHLDGREAEIILDSDLTRVITRKLWEKQLKGVVKHGFVMSVGDDKVNTLVEAQAEALDLAQYLEKAIGEVS